MMHKDSCNQGANGIVAGGSHQMLEATMADMEEDHDLT
jgi:hypothetical protein